MMETPRGVLNALDIAALPSVEGFVLGTNDLAKEIGCATGGDRMAMMAALQTVLLAARGPLALPALTACTTPSGTRKVSGPNANRAGRSAWTARP